jgi:hypothetical protein
MKKGFVGVYKQLQKTKKVIAEGQNQNVSVFNVKEHKTLKI